MGLTTSEWLHQLTRYRVFRDIREIEHAAHPTLSEIDVWEGDRISDQLREVLDPLESKGGERMILALALIHRAQTLMLETEPRHKCEKIADAMAAAANEMEETIEDFFKPGAIGSVESNPE